MAIDGELDSLATLVNRAEQNRLVELLERVARLEEQQRQAESQRVEMSKDIKAIKDTVQVMAQEQKVKDAKFGTVLWAASAMVTAVTTVIGLIIQWFKHVGTGGP